MKNVINLKLFSDYWIDCQSKNILSVLLSTNSTYRVAADMNNYSYGVAGRSGWYKAISIDYNEQDRFFLKFVERKKYDFKVNGNPVEELKKRIDEGRLISVRVDLFYWNPLSIQYHKIHSTHFSMCFGYDDEEGCFYFDDEITSETGYMKVTYDHFLQSICYENGKIFGIESKAVENIENFRYEFGDIVKNARIIMKSIRRITYTSPWSDFERTDDISMQITAMLKMYYRQTANACLFKCLMEDGHLSEQCYEKYRKRFADIEQIWHKLHNLTFRASLKNKGIDSYRANEESEQALNMEYNLWEDFVREFEGADVYSGYDMCEMQITDYVPTIKNSELSDGEYDVTSAIKIKEIRQLLNLEDEYTCIITVEFENVIGKLNIVGTGGLWKVRSMSADFPGEMVTKIDIENNTVKIYNQMPWHDITLRKYFQMSYEFDDSNNVSDDESNTIPEIFGLSLSERCSISMFIQKMMFSNIIETDKETKNNVEYGSLTDSLTWLKYVSDDYVVDYPDAIRSQSSDGGFFRRVYISVPVSESVFLHFGYVDSHTLWINGEKLAELPARDVKYCDYMKRIPVKLRAGMNELVVFSNVRKEKDERISLRLEAGRIVTDNLSNWMPELIFK